MHPSRWLAVRPEGLRVLPGDFVVDPTRPVPWAVVSHGHSDHARAGHHEVLATPATLAIMRLRLGAGAGTNQRPLAYGERIRLGEVTLWLAPAGHVLGSAQIVLEHAGTRVVYSGDYKRRPDPTCAAFVPVPCDLFVTEATFGLPVFCHPEPMAEIEKLLHARRLFPERCLLVGGYGLGKTQRVIALLRQAGHDGPLHLHPSLLPMCRLYEEHGVALGELRPVTAATPSTALKGAIVLAPPAALGGSWAAQLPDPITALASGWMRLKRRARASGVELPLVLSDHADWDELLQTLDDVGAPEVWVTHGRADALVHAARRKGIRARALTSAGEEEKREG